MAKYPAFVFAVLLSFSNCLADTFINRQTGESFNGYVTRNKIGGKTQVRIERKSPSYLNLQDYQVRRNHLGRKNRVYVFSIKDAIDLVVETEAFEKAIIQASNQGPFFILIELDTQGAHVDLARRICEAIAKTDNCSTVAFISGGRFSGAFAEAAVIALACDKVYMRHGTAIGAATPSLHNSLATETGENDYGRTTDATSAKQWLQYCSSIAERNNRPSLLVKAMLDKDIEVIEILEDDKSFLIDRKDKKSKQSVVHTWSDKESLLTLTADQAVRYGIADRIVASRDELFVDLDAAEAKPLRDTRIPKARKAFERAKQKVDGVLSSISDREQQADAIAAQIEAIEQNYLRQTGRQFWTVIPEVDLDATEEILIVHDQLSEQLLVVLGRLIVDYRKAISLAQKHPDLGRTATTLEGRLESTQAAFIHVSSRPRAFY